MCYAGQRSREENANRRGSHGPQGHAALRIAFIVFPFMIAWFPLYMYNFTQIICDEWINVSCPADDVTLKILVLISHLPAVWNPLMYGCTLKDYKYAIKNLLRCQSQWVSRDYQ